MAMKKKHGIPRTSKAADALGLKKVRVSFKTMKEPEKKNWVHIAAAGARHGAIGRMRLDVASPRARRIGPGSPGTVIVCYYDENTGEYTDCREIPAGSAGLPA
jgi:hypothetical protein